MLVSYLICTQFPQKAISVLQSLNNQGVHSNILTLAQANGTCVLGLKIDADKNARTATAK